MPVYEYKVVPAPMQGKKARGVKGTAARFAHGLESLMNELGADGWDYVRSDTLPCEERVGLTGRTTTFQNMLVFRRAKGAEAVSDTEVTALLEAPKPTPAALPEPPAAEKPEAHAAAAAAAAAAALKVPPKAPQTGAPQVGPAERREVAAE